MSAPGLEDVAGAPSQRLAEYLTALHARLRRAVGLQAAALLALVALLLTVAGSWLVIRTGFAAGTLLGVRLALLTALTLTALLLWVLPLRRLAQRREHTVERLTADFDGRLRTFGALPSAHPFRELLAQDTLSIAARHSPRGQVGTLRLAVPAAIAVVLTLTLLWLSALGPGLYGQGARAIWAGWLVSKLLPAQRLAVDPGDQAVRRGADVTVRSWAQGFDPARVQLHARVGNGSWQLIEMSRDPVRGRRDFAFTFFSVREPVSYYVSAGGIRSASYGLKVLDAANVEQLRLVYHYPDWTHRAPSVQLDNGDISAIAGTQVALQLRTDAPLPSAELVLDQVATPLARHGNDAQGSLTVAHDARYYLAERIGAQQVRLTGDYLIKVLPVPAPQVHITWPGRDYSASAIEEVSTDVQASDDYGLTGLELRYAVNGGAWRSVDLPIGARSVADEYVFSLESLRPDAAERAIAPGDLISYYAVASGHSLRSQSDMYFIDVQPFDRRFSQSQAAGGGDNEQQEISQRQRQILVSTWNLLRQRQQGGTTPAAMSMRDNATLLASLQSKLAAQAESLASRTQARELGGDPRIARFIDSMQRAAKSMQPAATHLAATDLSAAIGPEQQALQYLMQAGSQFTDMQVSVQRGGATSSAQSSRDVAQIYQLEMDLRKNQYESGNDASAQSSDRQADELARRLQSLAQREQQLADQLQQSQHLSPEQRWQQQSLQREAQELRQQLAQLQPASQGSQGSQAQGSQGSQSSQGSQARQGAQGASGSAGAASPGGPGGPGSVPNSSEANSPLAQRLDAAIREMSQAASAEPRDGANASEGARRAAQQAQQSLNGAGTELARERAASMQQDIDRLAERAGQLYAQQATTAQQLQAAVGTGTLQGHGITAGPAQSRLIEQTRELSAGVQRLGDQISAAERDYRSDSPQTAAALGAAGRVINDDDLVNHLDVAAEDIDQGGGSYIAPAEEAMTEALGQLRARLQAAAAAAGQAKLAANARPDPIGDELSRVRALRSQLQRLADAAQSAGSTASTANQGNAERTADAANERIAGAGAAAGPEEPREAGAAGGAGPGGGSLTDVPGARRQVAAGASGLVPLLRAQGADPQTLAQIERLARELGGSPGSSGRAMLLAEQLRAQIDVLDQLELQLARRGQSAQAIRAAVASLGAEQYQDAVAEYYRELSRQ